MLQKDRDWLDKRFDGLQDSIVSLREDVAGLKVKARIWGIFGGAIPVIVGIGVYIFTRGL